MVFLLSVSWPSDAVLDDVVVVVAEDELTEELPCAAYVTMLQRNITDVPVPANGFPLT